MNLTDFATAEFEHLILIIIRVSGLFIFAPFFSSQVWPFQIKVAATFVISWCVYLMVPHAKGEFLGEIGMFPYMVVAELMITFAVFFGAQLVFNGILMAGSLMGLHIGYAITSTIDPFSDAQNNILAQIYYMFGILIFIVVGGHHFLIRVLAYSFEIIPLGGFSFSNESFNEIIRLSNRMWIISLELSGPALLIMTFVTAGLALLAKAVPQMNIFAVGFLLKIVMGLLVILFTVEVSVDYFEDVFIDLQHDLIQMVRMSSPPS